MDGGVSDGSGAGQDATTATDGASPIPTGSWTNVTGNLKNMASQCGNMSYLSAKPDEDLLIAGIALDGLWSSKNGGKSWQPLGLGSDASPPITNRTSSIVYDPKDTSRYWESGLYNNGGVYETKDDGASLMQLGDAHHNDLVSIDFTDPNRQTLVAGGHEEPGGLIRSTDGGKMWSPISTPSQTQNCTLPLVLGPQTYLLGCNGYTGASGIYRTTNGGTKWTSVTKLGGAEAPLVASDGSIYWASPDGAGIARSTDQGETWSNVVVDVGSVASFHPIELPDGRIAAIGPQNGTQYVLVSADHGAHWSYASAALPAPAMYSLTGVVYSSQRKAFYVWYFTCSGDGAVPADAILSFDFDDEKN